MNCLSWKWSYFCYGVATARALQRVLYHILGQTSVFGSSQHPRGDFHDRGDSAQVQWISVKSMKRGGWSCLVWRSRGRDRAEIDEHALDLASRSRGWSKLGFIYSYRSLADLFMSEPGCFIHLWITPSKMETTKLPSSSSVIVFRYMNWLICLWLSFRASCWLVYVCFRGWDLLVHMKRKSLDVCSIYANQ